MKARRGDKQHKQSAEANAHLPAITTDNSQQTKLNTIYEINGNKNGRIPAIKRENSQKLNSIQYTRSMGQGATAHLTQKQNTHNKLNTMYETNETGSDCMHT